MRFKVIMEIMLTLLLIGILTSASNFESVKANSYIIKLSISPSTIIGPPPSISESFTVDVYIEDIVNLTGGRIGLQWDPAVLQCNSFTLLLPDPTDWIIIPGEINNTIGEVYPPYAYAFIGTAPWSGSGTIAQVELQVLNYGFTWINLTNIFFEYPIPPTVVVTNGTVQISQPAVGGIYIPVNKLELLAPYIGLTILLAVAVMTVGYVKKRKRNTRFSTAYDSAGS